MKHFRGRRHIRARKPVSIARQKRATRKTTRFVVSMSKMIEFINSFADGLDGVRRAIGEFANKAQGVALAGLQYRKVE